MQPEIFSYDNRIVKYFTYATIIWGIIGMVVGLLIAAQLAFPMFNFDVSFTTYGRLRPIHTNAVIFAFVGNAIFTGVYYSMQRLLKTRMYSDVLSYIHFWGWQLIIVLAAVTLALGFTISKEYAELEWPVDLLIAVIWIVFGWNMFGTIARRRVQHLYVAIWFYIASWVAVTILHVFNSIELPVSLFKSYPVYAGVQDALVQWWYGHNAVAFFLTTPFLGLMYYFLPKAANRPIYSYKLSIIHFWTLIFIYIWSGPHHLLYQALPDWAQTIGVIFSVMLIAPSWGGMINGLLTLRGVWDKVRETPMLKFMAVAVTAYGMVTFEGPMLAIKTINGLVHFTDWIVAHVHIGGLGWNGFLTFAMLYYLIPVLWRTKLYSNKLANIHFWLGTLGILFYAIPLYWAAITQGLMWKEFTPEGFLRYPNFLETVVQIIPMYVTRIVGGALYITGAFIMVYNLVKTIKKGSFVASEEVSALPLEKISKHRILGETIHGWVERKPVQFTFWVAVALLFGSIISIVPMFVVKTNIPTISSVKPYSPLELQGRDIYIREGCYTCHSQMVRPFRSETERYGEYSKSGEFVFDHPFQWGSRRMGPDLARAGVVGGKMYKTAAWHFTHFYNPQEMNAGSRMPSYPWLIANKLKIASTPVKIKAMITLGVPYPDGFAERSIDSLMTQAKLIADDLKQSGIEVEPDREIIAMIAYMHRLGRDISELKPVDAGAAIAVKAPDVLTDEASISIGAQVFKANCAACHGASGEGNAIGPNLTDNYWIHGGSPDSVYLTIHNGVPSKGMQAWKDLLTKLQLQQVYSFSLKIKGTNVSGGKAPQGKEGKF